MALQYVFDDFSHRQVLKNATLVGQRQTPQPRHQHRTVTDAVFGARMLLEARQHAVDLQHLHATFARRQDRRLFNAEPRIRRQDRIAIQIGLR